MSIVKPYTFTAGTKARANEVNQDFDTLYQQVNTNITGIEEANDLIENLEATKAELAGSTSQTFSVKDATSNYHAINKQTLFKYINNSLKLITGYTITEDSSGTNKIIVSSGSCYDNTYTVVLSSSDSISKTNTTQAASSTYYVYIIGDDAGEQVDALISTLSSSPTLPTGYTLYRRIGHYKTNSSKQITDIYYYGIPLNTNTKVTPKQSITYVCPDYDTRTSKSVDTTYTTTEPTWVYMFAVSQNNKTIYYYINGNKYKLSQNYNSDTDTSSGVVMLLLATGDKYKLPSDDGGSHIIYSFSCKGL